MINRIIVRSFNFKVSDSRLISLMKHVSLHKEGGKERFITPTSLRNIKKDQTEFIKEMTTSRFFELKSRFFITIGKLNDSDSNECADVYSLRKHEIDSYIEGALHHLELEKNINLFMNFFEICPKWIISKRPDVIGKMISIYILLLHNIHLDETLNPTKRSQINSMKLYTSGSFLIAFLSYQKNQKNLTNISITRLTSIDLELNGLMKQNVKWYVSSVQWEYFIEILYSHAHKNQSKRNLQLILEFMNHSKVYFDPAIDAMMIICIDNHNRTPLSVLIKLIRAFQKNKKIVPFELLYAMKSKIEKDIKYLKLPEVVLLLYSLSKLKLFFYEDILRKIYARLNRIDNLKKLSRRELVLVFSALSRLRFRDENLSNRILSFIVNEIHVLELIEAKLLVIGALKMVIVPEWFLIELMNRLDLEKAITILESIYDSIIENDEPRENEDLIDELESLRYFKKVVEKITRRIFGE